MSKQLHHFAAVLSVVLLSLLVSCSPKTDLKHIEPDAELSMGLALPIGDISITLNDFLGMGNLSNYLKVDDDSVLYYQDTFLLPREFHKIDLSSYVSNLDTTLHVYPELPAPVQAAGYVDGDGTTGFDFEFPITLEFSGINSDTDNERLDSMIIKTAQFTSTVSVENTNIDWQEIKQLDIVLGNAFSRKGGQTIALPIDGRDFSQPIPITIDDFTLNLMKDKTQPVGSSNVLTETSLTVRMRVVPAAGKRVTFNTASAFSYNLTVEFMDYDAIFGRFTPGKEMTEEDTVVMGKAWAGWNDLISLNLPLAEPEIFLQVKHHLGVPLTMYGRYLWVQSNQTGQKVNATFNRDGSKTHVEIPIDAVTPEAYAADTGAYAYSEFVFDEREEHGHLDKMFAIRPDILGYKFDILPNYTDYKQARITKNTKLDITALITVPLVFNEGVDFLMTDTVTNVNISQFSIDSLLDKAEFIDSMKTANLKLVLTTENYIPFDIHAHVTFIDYKNDSIPLQMNENNDIFIAGPSKVMGMDVAEPTKSINTLELDKHNLELLSTVKALRLTAGLGGNTVKVRLKASNYVKIKIGLAFDVEASLNMEKLLNTNDSTKTNQ